MLRVLNPWIVRSLLLIAALAQAASAQTNQNPSSYPFEAPPSEMVRLFREQHLVQEDAVADVELELLADAADGQLDEFSFDEALLVASGVVDPADRRRYVARLDQLAAEAEKTVDGAATKLEQGDRLLKFLHAQPMAAGYECNQTDLQMVLDTGRFNCVSSAALFNVLAERLGYKVRAVEIPQHCFSMFYAGSKWVDVETTNELGFNPSRDPAEREKLKKPNGVVFIPERDAHLRREVDELGLAAVIYYNHGVSFGKEKRHAQATLASFIALGLDPASESAAQNALAHVNSWALALKDGKKFEKAVKVVSLGLRAAPNDSTLLNNQKVIWQHYAQWEMQAGREEAAIAVLRRAAAAVPESDFIVRQAYLIEEQAEPLLRAGKLQEALAVVERGISNVDPPAQQRLRKWRSAHVHNHLLRTMRENLRDGQYEAALSAVSQHAKWLDANTVRSFQLQIYDTWAGDLAGKQKWQDAEAVYAEALQNLPGDSHLSHNAVVVYDRWARSYMQQKDWQAAIKVYEQGLEQFPGHSLLGHNLDYCKQQRG
jgi:tetratricopeptide (TPR) repeat protein